MNIFKKLSVLNPKTYIPSSSNSIPATSSALGLVKIPATGGLVVDGSGNLSSVINSDDPTNTSTLGAPAILRGTVYGHLASGVTVGSGQSQAVRTATLTGLQNAINYAGSNNKYFELEPNTYEIYGSSGLIVPATANNLHWYGSIGTQIVQFYANAPILTIGDVGNNSFAAAQVISGFNLSYGVSQSGNNSANALRIGSGFGNVISDFVICQYTSNVPYNGILIATSSTSNTYFFQNVLRDFQVGGCQRSLISWPLGGTGNLISNGYTHNGANASSRGSCSAAAWDLTCNGIASDNVFERCNIEHLVAAPIMQIQGFTSTTFIGLHLEDVALTGYAPGVFYQIGGHVKHINTNILDLVQSSVSGTSYVYGSAGYADYTSVDGLYMKWDNSFSGALTAPIVMVAPPSSQGNDTNPAITLKNVRIEDDTGNNSTSYLSLDSNISSLLPDGTVIINYQGDNLLPSTDKFQFPVKSNYTHYGLHQNAVLFVPATLGGATTITLSNKFKASGTGSSLPTPTNNRVRIRRQSGTYANTLAIVDSASGNTLTTNSASGADLVYAFNGTNWVAVS